MRQRAVATPWLGQRDGRAPWSPRRRSGPAPPGPRRAAPARARRRPARTASCDRRSRGRPPGRGSRAPCGSPTSSSPSRPSCRGPPSSRSRAVEGPPSRTWSRTRSTIAEVGLHPRPPPRAVAEELHPGPHHRPQLDRHEGLDVRPVLDHPARLLLRGPLEHVGVVGTHPREQRHVVGPLEHVDRVDLQHAGAGEGAREGAHRGGGVARVAEPLGDEGDAARLRPAQRGRDGTPRG